MPEAAIAQPAAPFESASELRQAHARLLEALDSQLGQDASSAGETAAVASLEPDIRPFLERGAATGVYLEATADRTACQVLLDYWVSSLAQTGLPAPSARLARFDDAQLPDLKDKPCPYVGLGAFQDKNQAFFFGRESDTRDLVAQLRATPLVVVAGASGSGKSSLVMGGVLPALAAEGPPPALRIVPPFVPGNAMLEHLVDAVRRSAGGADAGPPPDPEALRKDAGWLLALLGGTEAPPTLITIDQFEEVFTLSNEADREALVAALAVLLDAGRGHRVILTMREEFKSRFVELRALASRREKAWYSMRPMAYEELRAAVERPAALVNLQFQAGIVDDLVKKVLGQPAALPLLQFTLQRLWEKRDRNRITQEVYDRVGDPLKALRTSADRFYDRLAPQTQIEMRRILLELVWVDELLEAYRRPVPKSQLLAAGKANTDEVLALLEKRDYIRISPDGSGVDAVVEVEHESLVRNWPRLVEWIDEKRMAQRQRLALTTAAAHWAESGKPAAGLLTGWQLAEATTHANLSPLEKEFVQASEETVERARRETETALRREKEQAMALVEAKRRLLRGTSAALIFVIVAAVLMALYFGEKTNQLHREAAQLKHEKTKLAADVALFDQRRKDAERTLIKTNATLASVRKERDRALLLAKVVGPAAAAEKPTASKGADVHGAPVGKRAPEPRPSLSVDQRPPSGLDHPR
jgi:hypothetical protein